MGGHFNHFGTMLNRFDMKYIDFSLKGTIHKKGMNNFISLIYLPYFVF